MILLSDPSLKEPIGDWVKQQISDIGELGFNDNYSAIGVFDDYLILAGCVYHDWNPRFKTICMSIAARSPRWASRRTIEGLLRYPFIELDVQRITVIANASNFASLRLIEGVGFKREALLERAAWPNDVIVFRMFAEEFLQGKFYRKEKSDGFFIETKSSVAA